MLWTITVMEQLDILPKHDQSVPCPHLPETTRERVLRLMARLLLDLVYPHDDNDPGGPNDE